jgi:hypothetical protein
MAKPSKPVPAAPATPASIPAPVTAGPQDITQLELAEIVRKLEQHGGDRNSLTSSELAGLHQHERFVRVKQHATEAAAAATRAAELPQRNVAQFKARLAGLVAARNKVGIAAMIRDLENCQRARDGREVKGDQFIAIEIQRHQARIARLKKSLARSGQDALAIKERIAAATTALATIDDVNKCPNCGRRASTKRNLDEHLLTCKPKPAGKKQ